MDIASYFHNDISEEELARMTCDNLRGMDEGELYLQHEISEGIILNDSKIESASFDSVQGFGLRGVLGDTTGFGYSSHITEDNFRKAASVLNAVKIGRNSHANVGSGNIVNRKEKLHLYDDRNPISARNFDDKVKLLFKIDNYLRSKSDYVKQVSASISLSYQAIRIMSKEGQVMDDIRPLVRMDISCVLEREGRTESGSQGRGGRISVETLFDESLWRSQADEAFRIATVNLDSRPTPAGEMEVILGAGWPGILLHEAVGHGLEGDFNRKGTSVFSGKMGEMVAAKGVTVVDDGTIASRRGSLNFDDEGTKTERNILIEDGRLVGYLQDKMNARLMGVKSTGNGRRESFAYQPMPRMTNTFMLNGDRTREELIRSVKRGILAVNFNGGQVDITTGKFVFSATEGYYIEDGEIKYPVKGATLIGSGSEVMRNIVGIGNDMALDPGVGTCGKNGQGVPVGVGQPSLLISKITVGGTEV